jgi:two-component system LytT family sensor kinase
MKIRRLSKAEIWKHLLNWVLISIFLQLMDPVSGTLLQQIYGVGVIMVNYMFVYYSLLLVVLPNFWENKRIWLLPSLLLVYFIFAFLSALADPSHLSIAWANLPFLLINILLLYFFVGMAALSSFTNKRSKERIQQQDEQEKQLIFKELVFLKNRFNADVTFKFLNYIHVQTSRNSEDAAGAIGIFSKMMNYSLQVKPGDDVSLKQEVDYIADFISLHQHLSSNVFVRIESEGELENKRILPRLLIAFVENAFKHGLANDSQCPIRIAVSALPQNILFKVENKKNPRKKVEVSGIGQANLKQMLELFYPKKHTLHISETDDTYSTELMLAV